MKIEYIKNEKVNRLRYDNALKRSFNANVFAYSWYLDLVCDDWDLLVQGEYETVCPIPLTKKLGLSLVRQPKRAPFLGVFSSTQLPPEKVVRFLKAIPFRSIHLTLNHLNRFDNLRTSHQRLHVPVLDLILTHEKTMKRYSEKGRRMATQKDGVFVMRSIRTDEYMFFKRSQKKGSILSNMQLTRIMNYAIRYKSAGIYSVYSPRNELIGAAFFIRSNNHLYLIDKTENPEGRRQHAIFRVINHIIETNSESNLTLELPFGDKTLETMIDFDHHHCLKYRKGLL